MTKFKAPSCLKSIDLYLKIPILFDMFFTCTLVSVFLILQREKVIIQLNQDIIKSLYSDLITTSITLAGFVLASLTIIVTFKDTISGNNKNLNGRYLFFKSEHYLPTVKIFFRSSIVLLFIFLLLSITKIINNCIPVELSNFIILGTLLMISMTILRSLLLLLQIIKIQNQPDKNTTQ